MVKQKATSKGARLKLQSLNSATFLISTGTEHITHLREGAQAYFTSHFGMLLLCFNYLDPSFFKALLYNIIEVFFMCERVHLNYYC